MKKQCCHYTSIIVFCFFVSISLETIAQTPQLGKSSVQKIMSTMTLREKSTITVGGGRMMEQDSENGMIGAVEDNIPGAAGLIVKVPRLSIPTVILADGLVSARIDPIRNNDTTKTYYGSSFPISTMLTSSWDTAIVNSIGVTLGNEMKAYGIDVALASALNIIRNPLNGCMLFSILVCFRLESNTIADEV
ncbi:MAG: hypothetical protein JKX79_00060 [Labilibaculum sp.]|nr:hypothetical protein [Labilibaculum sp.]